MKTSLVNIVFKNKPFSTPGNISIAKSLMCEQNLLLKRKRNQLKL